MAEARRSSIATELEERGGWSANVVELPRELPSMPDSQQNATVGHVRDLVQRLESAQRNQHEQFREYFQRIERDEDERWDRQDKRSDAIERAISDMAKEVRELQGERTRFYDAYRLLKGVFAVLLAIIGTGLVFAWQVVNIGNQVLTGNNDLITTIQRSAQRREQQNNELIDTNRRIIEQVQTLEPRK